ncbi:alpha/beta fold hydrolase [Streptomyces sp. TRM 70351]|uniref:thioesterase II family protein n=1 Tax=Streptomyces sp. TRM 70351 TaxID=3116552 RepID=UPI002E7BC760|nr:alpha/beta fold hydrolase [Streptomyces sp. TRM 70351]MEE1931545.1 alpha/beta fold hydrolase [Streptomyces sp. TRM 70351]
MTADDWFRRFTQVPPTAPLLVCFPHAGGAASAYLALARALDPDVEVLAVQYPGRQDRRLEAPVSRLTGLAEAVDAALDARLGGADRHFAFFGHSMGASVAYETARLRAAAGRPGPAHLFLSGRGAPSTRPRPSDQLSTDAELVAEVRRLGGTVGRVLDDPEMLEMVMPVLRADYTALRGYRWEPGPPLAAPFTVLVGDADPVVPVADAAGWTEHSSAGGEVRTFPGGHFYLDAAAAGVAAVVRSALARSAAATAAR